MEQSIAELVLKYEDISHILMGSFYRNLVGWNGVLTRVLRFLFHRLWEISKMPARERTVESERKCCERLRPYEHAHPNVTWRLYLDRHTQILTQGFTKANWIIGYPHKIIVVDYVFFPVMFIYFGISDLGFCDRHPIWWGLRKTRVKCNAHKRVCITTTFAYSFINNASVIAY
jgi:hypothetical protein